MAAGAKKKRRKSGSGWSWRLAGLALCAFFALGLLTGLSQSGRMLAHRIEALLQCLPHSGRSELIPAAFQTFFIRQPAVEKSSSFPVSSRTEAIALIEHSDGFYQIDRHAGLFGPVPPAETMDLPVLSGSGIQHVSPAQLLDIAGELIRAEAILATRISEMHTTSDGEISLYLEGPQLVIVLLRAGLSLELARTAKVLSVWRRRQQFIGMIDMTVPDEAIVRFKNERFAPVDRVASRALRRVELNLPVQDGR